MAFRIKNLKCSYNKSDVVLYVPELDIDTGSIMFVLGKSGSGKSTLLEVLALMNNTFKEGQVFFNPCSLKGATTYDYNNLWNTYSEDDLAHMRAEYFSFIFQQTNLMPNFSAFQNIYISLMIEGYSEKYCLKKTSEVLTRIGLSEVEADADVTQMSGGQRQRLAFARAIISNFDVLFGDEPTGNLDECNANELMKLLTEYIHDKQNNSTKTALMVTHNIEIALKYADSIVMISGGKGKKYGCIEPEAKFNRKTVDQETSWSNGVEIYDEHEYKSYLKQQFYLS